MKIALYGRLREEPLPASLQVLFDKLASVTADLYLHKDFEQYLSRNFRLAGRIHTYTDHSFIRGQADYLLSIGGDGTLLETIEFVRNSGIPVLGINTGRLGFLASVMTQDEIIAAVDALRTRQYTLDKRTLIKVTKPDGLFGDVNYAMNEITIQRKDSTAMMTIHVWVNGAFLNSYWADGMILSTPTGSTAYSLSCGGPLMMPDARSFIITPLSPHNLNVRPLIIPDDSTIRLKVEGRSSHYLASLDSRTVTFEEQTEFIIQREDFKINLIRLNDQHFFNTLRTKLNWGMDQRN